MAKGKKSKGTKGNKEVSEKDLSIVSIPEEKQEEKPKPEKKIEWISSETENDFVYHVADFFKVFGDATRIKLLSLLAEGELCVGDIAEKLEMSQSAVSHQLRVLRQNDLVKYKKDGKTVFYSLDDEHVRIVLEQGMTHIRHKKGYAQN